MLVWNETLRAVDKREREIIVHSCDLVMCYTQCVIHSVLHFIHSEFYLEHGTPGSLRICSDPECPFV